MPENDRLSGCLDEINLGFVEREATPPLLMKLSIQLDDEQYWLYAAVFAATGAHRRSPRGSIRGIGGRRRPPIGDLLRYCFGGDFLIPESRVFRRFVRLTACFRVGEEPAGIDMGPAGFEPEPLHSLRSLVAGFEPEDGTSGSSRPLVAQKWALPGSNQTSQTPTG